MILETRGATYDKVSYRDGESPSTFRSAIIAWDDEGYALIGVSGRLMRAEDLYPGGCIALPTLRERVREAVEEALEVSTDLQGSSPPYRDSRLYNAFRDIVRAANLYWDARD